MRALCSCKLGKNAVAKSRRRFPNVPSSAFADSSFVGSSHSIGDDLDIVKGSHAGLLNDIGFEVELLTLHLILGSNVCTHVRAEAGLNMLLIMGPSAPCVALKSRECFLFKESVFLYYVSSTEDAPELLFALGS